MQNTKPNTPNNLFLPDNYLRCGKAIVAFNPQKKVWVAPGGREISSPYQADALGWKINDLILGEAK